MKILIESEIKKDALNDINYIIHLVQSHTSLSHVISELETCNFPNLLVGNGSSHVWVKQLTNGKADNERTLFIS